MARPTRMEREQFTARLARELPGWRAEDVDRIAEQIMALGGSYRRAQERWLEDPDKRATHRLECREARIVKRLEAILKELGPDWGAVFSDKLEVNTVKLQVPSGLANDWAGEGVCVPGS